MRSFPLLLIVFFLCTCFAVAQTTSKISVGVGITPLIAMSFNSSSSSDQVHPPHPTTYAQYSDSIRSSETYRVSFGVHGYINYRVNKNWVLQGGLGYIDVGFQRQQKNIQLGDLTYPGIGDGKLIELSNSNKSINYNYRYQYLQIPLLANYQFKRSHDFKWIYSLSGGIGLNILLCHNITANLDQFYVDNKQSFDIDSSGYDGRFAAINMMLGGKVEYHHDKNIWFFAQPTVGFYPISVSSSRFDVYPMYIGLTLGAVYSLRN